MHLGAAHHNLGLTIHKNVRLTENSIKSVLEAVGDSVLTFQRCMIDAKSMSKRMTDSVRVV